jgi:UDP-N-acetylmuramoyl-L-alanyl-D-glutamate--2,6-diaminopimelate ligase
MEAYFEAKARLFQPGQVGVAVVNRDDPWGARLADRLSTQGFGGGRMLAYAASEARDVVLEPSGSRFSWGGQSFAIHLGGLFNVANAVAAIACARALDIAPEVIATGLASVQSVPGRFQLVDAGQPFTVIVDYAHTPDGLTKVLSAAKQVTQGRLIVVFGAGGDRDREKRPLMGEAAVDLADLVVVTSDNPRSEDPGSIIAEIMAPVGNRENVLAEPDRAAAIATAVGVARPGDVVVVAGKGHEKGQEIAGRVLPFDDVEVARAAITRIRSSREPGGVDGEVGS